MADGLQRKKIDVGNPGNERTGKIPISVHSYRPKMAVWKELWSGPFRMEVMVR